ncbi:hypothetical protein, partial [Nocardioides sp. SYSU DS0663]|uniref:hypothetical protein n=1 Tax=Nocardioides sp. SYSU DS0663 TaxID=3416445 RepID=UPI003F4C789B
MIDTAVAGRPGDVRAAAAWLRAMRSATAASQDLLVRARRVAREDWAGSAAEAYAGAGRCVLGAGDRHEQRLLRAATLLEEYADRLAAVQRQMADVRCRAAAGGLVVRGPLVAPPRDPQRLALWTQLAEEVARARADHEAWISGRLAPEATRGDDLLGDVRDALLQRAAPFLTTAGTVLGTRRLGQMAERMLAAGADARRRAEEARAA